MRKTQGVSIKMIVGLILLACLIAFAVITGTHVIALHQQVALEAASTPTPLPTYLSIMQVTVDPNAPTPEPVLRIGSAGEAVINLQKRLQALGYYTGEIDGQYGNGTQNAVLLFQQQNGITADGLAGSETQSVLASDSAIPAPTPTPSPTPVPTLEPTQIPAARYPWIRKDGLPLLVNASHPLPDGYEPLELIKLKGYCSSKLVNIKGNDIQGERVAVDALIKMLEGAVNDGVSNWQISAGWRSVKYQQTLFNRQVSDYEKQGLSHSKAVSATKKLVAVPGCSEHHTGLSFDITTPGKSFKGTKQANWLEAHCWEYGFILRYPEGKQKITGITNEAWHFRYVGTEHSLIMRDEDLCLEEYIDQFAPLDS